MMMMVMMMIGDDGSRIFYHCPLYACLLQVKFVPMTWRNTREVATFMYKVFMTIITIITTHLHCDHHHHYDDHHHYYHQHHYDYHHHHHYHHHYYSGLKVIPQCVPLWRLLIKLETAVKGSMKARATGEMCRLKVPYTLTDLCLLAVLAVIVWISEVWCTVVWW